MGTRMNHRLRRRRRPTRDFRRDRAFRKLTADVVRDQPICWLRLPGCTIRSQTADHVIPYSERPDLAMIRQNLRGACHKCNINRKNTPVWKLPELRARMIREQQPARALEFFQGKKNGKVNP